MSREHRAAEEQLCPYDAVQAAEALCGPVVLEPVTDRRGSAVWRAVGPNGAVAVKAGEGDGALVTAREGEVADRLGLLGTHGVSDGVAWLVTPWFDGPSTREVFAPVRAGDSDRAAVRAAAVDLCRAVADLHARGWVHADLQPEHAIHTKDGVRLIDLSWAWRPGFEPSEMFRGGIPHLLAPELAAAVVAGVRPAAPSPAAEVYTLAGVLWTCITGRWPLDYERAGLLPRELGAAGVREAIATGGIPLDADRPWPELQQLLEGALLAPAGERPTAAELAGQISDV
ncbi:hypothetical protein DDQ41_15210 [Streptomyces spongiicola]|uniref:Protein kinase domain-containing protein n=1 Tax=Streptomyces spongiicola TaxID=1690221 RepID=A0ABN5KNV8_9ACTN|nr:serine/threonine-protein kinase [Streptomyces spongiicola]AWK10021.1 hypothetical protein DDQ41_15210 [Streptomyces spongiicola]